MLLALKHNHRFLLFAITVAVVVVFGVVFFPSGASAIFGDSILGGFLYAISWLVYGMVMLGGQILTLLLVVLIWVASYNNFINEPIVNVGWVLVRDLANMVFIVALLYMAFNMVFGIRGKGGSLLTLIINAGLINFSKMIAGLFIDVSQVVMLTFVHGFYDIAAGNLLEAFGLQDILSFNPITNDVLSGGSTEAGTITIFITIVAALIMIYVAIGVVLTIIIVLFGRVFQLWGMLIFSPLPYVAKILPAFGQVGVGGDWWSKFSKLLVSGPILAFYLWLAFTAVELYTGGLQNAFGNRPDTKVPVDRLGGDVGTTGPIVGLAKAGEVEHIMAFMIMIGILMLALQQANQFGIATAGFAGKARGWLHKKTGVKAFNRFIKEPLASKQQLWAQGGGIMKYGNKFLASLPGPLRTSWAGLTTKEGEAREKATRDARRQAKGWQRTIEGTRVPWRTFNSKTGKWEYGMKGWKAGAKVLMGEEDEAKKMEKRATAARSSIMLSRHIQNAEEWQKLLEKTQGYDTMDGKQLREEFNQYRTSRKIPENIEKMIAVANMMSKKGVWNTQDEDAYAAGAILNEGIGGREHLLLSQKIERDSEAELGKARAQAITPFFTDPVTREIINIKEQGVLVDDGTGTGRKRRSRDQSDILHYVTEQMNRLSRSQGATENIRQFGRGILKSPLLGKFLLHKADEQNPDIQGEPLEDKALTDRMKDVQIEVNGVMRPLWESFNIEDVSSMTPQQLAKDYRIQRYHDVLGPFLHDLLDNLEHYKEEISKQLQQEGRITTGMDQKEQDRQIAIWMQDKDGLNLTPEGIRAVNQNYRLASMDPKAKLFAIDEGVKEIDEQGNEVTRDIPIKKAKRKDITKVREVGKKEEKEEKELNQIMQYSNTSRNRSEDYLDEHKVDRAKSDRDSLAQVVVDGHHELSKFMKSLERVMEKLAPDLKETLEPLRQQARQLYSENLDNVRREPDEGERRKLARQTLDSLRGILDQLKTLDEDVKKRERANGRGRRAYEDDDMERERYFEDDET